jgi:histidyl-tRNA synthetase
LDCKSPQCQPVADDAPRSIDFLCPECAEHYDELKRYLGSLEILFKENRRLVRGFDYYTRTVFEIHPEKEGSQSALGGGGRYDDLIEELGGKPTPGLGFACGMERIILNIKDQNVDIPPIPTPQVFIASLGDDARVKALKLAATLRQASIGVIQAVGSRSLKAQLRQANNLNIPTAVIIGAEELKTDTVILRDMTTSQQKTIPTSRLQEELQ